MQMHDEPANTNLQRTARWYVFVRLLFLLALSVPGILAQYLTEGFTSSVERDLTLLLVGIASNALFFLLIRVSGDTRYLQWLVRILVATDILLITALIFIKGGIESRSPILYTLPIFVSAAIFGQRASYMAAIGCSIGYIGLVLADYANIIHSVGAFDSALRSNLPYVIQSICFFPSVLFVIALAADFITNLLTEKQRQVTEHLDNLITAQEIAKLGSWEWDINNDTITWSKQLYKLFGVQPGTIDLKYDTYIGFVHPDDTKVLTTKIGSSIKKNIAFAADHRIVTQDGSLKYVHSEGRPVVDSSGHVIKLTGTAQDVTDMHILDIAKRDFISLASHQLRTPASGVKAFLSLLLDNHAGKLSRKQRHFITKANESNNRQLEIIDALLNLASIQSGKIILKKQKVDLRAMLKHSLVHHRSALKSKHHQLVVTKPRTAVAVNADPTYIQMAIDNLISNAIKYTPDQGNITIAIRTTKAHAFLEVTDTGIGIAKHDISALFQKFNRLNNPASSTVNGSGLGLYLAQSVVKLHSGDISVRSRLGEGTRFTIKLPLSKAKG